MESNIFVTNAKRAVMASVAGVFLTPQHHTPMVRRETMVQGVQSQSDNTLELREDAANQEFTTIRLDLSSKKEEWTPKLEKEFRKLALAELKGEIEVAQQERLEELNRLRDRINNPAPIEDTLKQLQHDRIMQKISDALKEYVEFKERTS